MYSSKVWRLCCRSVPRNEVSATRHLVVLSCRSGARGWGCLSSNLALDQLLLWSANRVYMPQMLERYTSAGIPFFVNPRTNKRQWSPPRARERFPTEGAQRLGMEISGGGYLYSNADKGMAGSRSRDDLPEGWQKRTTSSGRSYYANHERRCEACGRSRDYVWRIE